MKPTKAMVWAARRAEFDYYQKGRLLSAERFVGTPEPVIRAMLEAALMLVEVVEPYPPTGQLARRNVTAPKPEPRLR